MVGLNKSKRSREDGELWLKAFHKSVCTLYTFLASSKRKIIITYDVLKPMVEKQLSSPVTVEDFAKIKALIPDEILFEYIDEKKLKLDIEEIEHGGGQDVLNEVLVFEYLHGKIKARKPAAIALEIRNLISERIKAFDKTLDTYVKSKQLEEDWEVRLEKEVFKYVPVKTVYDDPMELMMVKTKDVGHANSKISSFLEALKAGSDYRNQIVAEFDMPQRIARYSDLKEPLPEVVMHSLKATFNIERLYSHQAEAINELNKGNQVVVTTATSSGKSLIYQLPVLLQLFLDPNMTAIYIFPTKALAQDQKRHLNEMLEAMPDVFSGVYVDTYDGDTPHDQRAIIRQHANIIFTNPDILHSGILRYHDSWARFLSKLRFVVLDELHYYDGIFGTHVAYVMRRLRRLVEQKYNYGGKIQFVSCSATIKNPGKLFCEMFGFSETQVGHTVSVIAEDGSPYGEKHYALWECPLITSAQGRTERVHPVAEATKIMLELASRRIRTIAFCPVRKTCELLMKSIRQAASDDPKYERELANQIISYRGGYSAEDRRKIEREMFNGNLLGIVATNALEIGIDVGGLDAVINVGFPFSISSFRQQVGRAGRRNQDSLAMLICGGGAVDQFYVKNPSELVDGPDVEILLSMDNQLLRDCQLSCANAEMKLSFEEDEQYFGNLSSYIDNPGAQPRMKIAAIEGYQYSLRGKPEVSYAVVDTTNGRNAVIEEIEESRVTFTLYDGGIFLHKGQTYLILEFNHDGRFAKVKKVNVDWLTRQRDLTDVDPIDTRVRRVLSFEKTEDERASIVGHSNVYFGVIKVKMLVFGFFKVNSKDQIIDEVEVESIPHAIERQGFWINVPKHILDLLSEKNLSLAGAIHGAEHAIISMMPTITKSAPGEILTECKAPEKEFSHKQTSRIRPGRLIFYSSRVEATGSARSGYRFAEDLLRNAARRLDGCSCEWGCPGCVALANCKERNEVLSKIGARVILRALIKDPLLADEIPQGPEPNMPEIAVETICTALD